MRATHSARNAGRAPQRERWSLVCLLLAVAVMIGREPEARAQKPDPRDLEARTHFTAGEYQKALALYAQLYAETLHVTYLRNVGRCQQRMGEPEKAIVTFRQYLKTAEGLDAEQRAEVEGFIREMEELKEKRRKQQPPAFVLGQPPARRADEGVGRAPFYKRWWFWSGVAALAAGATVAIALSTNRGSGYQKGSLVDFSVPAGN